MIGNAAKQKQRTARFLAQRSIGDRSPRNAAKMLAAARAATASTGTAAKQPTQATTTHARANSASTASFTAAWQPVGPAQVSTAAYGLVTGRVTSIAADPSDASGNTIYVGSTGGGVWKSTNAVGSGAVFAPLTDTLGVFGGLSGTSISIGAVTVQPGGTGVVLAGTGDPNNATDSYYGSGILRSADNGLTWSLISESSDTAAGAHEHFTFFGNSFAGFAWSTTSTNVVAAAVTSAAEGPLQESVVNAGVEGTNIRGLYYSQDAGQTWNLAAINDGSQTVQSDQTQFTGPGNAAMAVVWNPIRQMFYAAVRYHGYYQSADGITWTRLAHQPGANFSTLYCPALQGLTGSPGCPIFRGVLAVQPVTGDTFALTVDDANLDQGLWQDVCGLTSGACSSANVTFANQIGDAAIEAGAADATIPQADYDLYLAAVPSRQDTLLFVGTEDVYRCSLANACAWHNSTNATTCMSAMVAPAQHALDATSASLGILYFGNDGGLWSTSDLVNEQMGQCSSDDANHYQNLNGGLGSLAEVESLALDASNAGSMMASLGVLGTAAPPPGTGAGQTAMIPWIQVLDGEGNYGAIDPADDENWYATSGFGVAIDRCTEGSGCDIAGFGQPVIGNTQVDDDGYQQIIPAPWILDPRNSSQIILGTCRMWRGPATGGNGWSDTDLLSSMLDGDQGPFCDGNAEVRSLAASGGATDATGTPELLYAGMAGPYDGGGVVAGHVFSASTANAGATAAWTDLGQSPVSNAAQFNPGGFDISSLFVDPHDPTGQTVYVTIEGFGGNGITAAKVYASTNGGASWTNITNNLSNSPANSIVIDPNDANTAYVATDAGVWVTTNIADCANSTSSCWNVFGTSLPNAPPIQLATFNQGSTAMLRVATYGRGVWEIPLVTAATVQTAASITPTSLIFLSQAEEAESAPQQLLVTNIGTISLNVTSVSVTGDFSEEDTCAGATIAAGGACTVSVSFTPTQTGSRSGVLTVYGNLSGGQITAGLSGTGTAPPSIVLLPTQLSFAPTLIGQTAAAQDVTISNTGAGATTLISESVSGDYAITADTCGSSLSSNYGCTVSIAFSPTASGSRTGTLTVMDSVGTQTVSLSGTGLAPATDGLSPPSLAFGSLVIGEKSAAQQVTLANNGDQSLQLISAQISGDFAFVNDCGTSLAGHSSCAITVEFVPTQTGAETGTLTVSDIHRSQTVSLSGVGLAPAGTSATPAMLNFGNYAVGGTSQAQTVTVTDNGGAGLAGLSYAITGDFSISTRTCGSGLAAGADCTLDVVFSPTVTGVRSGILTVIAAGQAPLRVALVGNGEDFQLQVSGSSSATVISGQTATYQLQIAPVNGSTGSVTLACTGAPQYSTCTVNPTAPIMLTGNSTAFATVTVATGQAVTTSAGLRSRGWLGAGSQLLSLVMPLGLAAARRRRRFIVALLGFATLLLLAGCGLGVSAGSSSVVTGTGNTPVNATPSGTYTITVTATAPGLSRSVQLTLNVE
jgi:Abnormal spindle-like microcephaly-assoc'd, ASPM-SPD-2-Hydin